MGLQTMTKNLRTHQVHRNVRSNTSYQMGKLLPLEMNVSGAPKFFLNQALLVKKVMVSIPLPTIQSRNVMLIFEKIFMVTLFYLEVPLCLLELLTVCKKKLLLAPPSMKIKIVAPPERKY